MRKKVKGVRSVFLELTVVLLVSALVAGIFFVTTYGMINAIMSRYVKKTDIIKKQSDAYAEEVIEYINENGLENGSFDYLDNYIDRKTPISVMIIYDDTHIIYDSTGNFPQKRIFPETPGPFPEGSNYDVVLDGKQCRLYIYGNYTYSMYNTVIFVEILISCIIMIMLFLMGIRNKIDYIRILRDETEILEGGALDHPITVKGNDELAELASGLDQLRRSFIHKNAEAGELARANRDMVTEMSHDLRTPLTSVLLYAEILQNTPDLSEEKKNDYINKITRKIRHMKELSDRLLTYSHSDGDDGNDVDFVPTGIKTLFFDELSDFCGYLEEQGFSVDCNIEWTDNSVIASAEYVSRILNNISSNIRKYADPSCPVKVSASSSDGTFELAFENALSECPSNEGSGIGIGSIRSMMKQMGGVCDVRHSDVSFVIRLIFSLAKN